MCPVNRLHKVSLVIFDLDGTLYNQRQLRFRMAWLMARELAWSSAGRRKMRIIDSFRKVREKLADIDAEDIVNLQYSKVSSKLAVSTDEVKAVTDEWLLRRPLPMLNACRAPFVENLFEQLRRSGKLIAVLSDYPADDKLNALGLEADLVVAATDPEVNRFKPNPKGLMRLQDLTNVIAEQCLLIGDREERDGECARRIGTPFLLKKNSPRTSQQGISCYSELLIHPL